MTGQHVRQSKDLSGQYPILTGHCPLTGRYLQPCVVGLLHSKSPYAFCQLTIKHRAPCFPRFSGGAQWRLGMSNSFMFTLTQKKMILKCCAFYHARAAGIPEGV